MNKNNPFQKLANDSFISLQVTRGSRFEDFKKVFKEQIQWIPDNFTVARLKPVLRSAVAGWIAVLFIIIPGVQVFMGEAGLLILVAAFLSPPNEPFVGVIERELIILTFVSLSFGWSCLAMKIASLTRAELVPAATLDDIFAGKYVQPVPTIICAIFLTVGTSLLLFVKARNGPGPFLFSAFLGCTTLDISLTIAPLFPYPHYKIARGTVIPIVFHSIITIVCSIILFPETVNAQFGKQLSAVLNPLRQAFEQQSEQPSRLGSSESAKPFVKQLATAEAALTPLAASVRLIKRDVSWGRFGPSDLSKLHQIAKRLTVRANGMAFFYKIMDPFRDDGFAEMPQPSTPGTSQEEGYPLSRFPSSTTSWDDASSSRYAPSIRPKKLWLSHHRLSPFPFSHGRNSSLIDAVYNESQESAVGVFESKKSHNLESRLLRPEDDAFAEIAMNLLAASAKDLLGCSADALRRVVWWLEGIHADRIWSFLDQGHRTTTEDVEITKKRLNEELRLFKSKKRHTVLELYRANFDSKHPKFGEDAPPHRYLYQCFVYQYHLMQFAELLCEMLEDIDELEKTRRGHRLWLPVLPVLANMTSPKWDPLETLEQNGDEDPYVIPGLDGFVQGDLGVASRRDPDALPPGTRLQTVGLLVHRFVTALGHGNALFAIKAAILTILLSLPSFLPRSAKFAYVNRFVWALFMGQMTLSRFRGDTAFEYVSRLLATFLGCLVGMFMWYISSGSTAGNPFGVVIVSLICFPFFFFIRLYGPGSLMSKIIFLFTAQLVVGYSWQDRRSPSYSSPGIGYRVAWRRFVLVSMGVTAAFLFSFLPPSTTLRRYIRTTYARTIAALGQRYCDIISYAHEPAYHDSVEIANDLIAIRMKLKRCEALRSHVNYEVSLHGKWPAERYDKILKIQLEITYLLSHMNSVVAELQPGWSKAFLRRTQFLESDFQGIVLAVISMVSTSLRTGMPLPQITPCPLLDRFTSRSMGLYVFEDGKDDTGENGLTMEALENEQYLCYSVGVATAFGVITRLDKLMLATKELVGEQYHINGIGQLGSYA